MVRSGWLVLVGAVGACSLFPDVGSIDANPPLDASVPLGDASVEVDAGADAGAVDSGSVGDATVDAAPLDPYAAAVVSDQPEAYFPLDEESGRTALDATGHGHVGTFVASPSRIGGGARGRALDIAGSGALSLGQVFDFDATESFTVEMWVKFAFSDSSYRYLFDKSGGTPRRGYGMFLREDALAFERRVNDEQVSASAGGELTWLGKWIHFVAVYDGAALAVYVNGEPFATRPDARSQPSSNATFVIGARSSTTEGAILGAVDEVAIYGKALPQTRIRAHYVAALTK